MTKIARIDVLEEQKTFRERIVDLCEHWFYLYNIRQNIVQIFSGSVQKRLQKIGLLNKKMRTPDTLLQMFRVILPENITPNQYTIRPSEQTRIMFRDNSAEYRSRYNPFKRKTLIQQTTYLEKFLRLANDNNTRVYLLNMPLTSDNLSLLPATAYDQYLHSIEAAAAQYGAVVVDLNRPSLFAKNDFCDPIHLNGNGGMKLCRMVASRYPWQQLLN
jgi:hypothetical protein